MTTTNLDQFLKIVKQNHNKIGLVLKINGIIEKTYKYEKVFESADELRKILRKHGSNDGKRIAVAIDCCPEIISIIIGILQGKNTYCPIVYNNNEDDLLNSSIALNSDFIITLNRIKNNKFEFIDEFKILLCNFCLYKIKEISTIKRLKINYCYAITTTGTTGIPKIVNVSWDCIWPNVKYLSEIYKIQNYDVILPTSPVTFDPFILDVLLALYNGAVLLFTQNIVKELQISLEKLFQKKNSAYGVTIMFITPSVFQTLNKKAIEYLLNCDNSLRILTFGGESFPNLNLFKSMIENQKISKKRVFNIYGITEVSCWASIYELNILEDIKTVSLGNPIDPSTIFKVEDGELYIGSKIRKCLLNNENEDDVFEKEQLIFRPTGDLIESINGELFYKGRTNSIKKRYGHRINICDIENTFLQIPNIKNAICIFLEENQDLLLFLNVDDTVDIQEHYNKLTPIEKPNKIFLLNQIQTNINGKIDKNTLLKMYQMGKCQEFLPIKAKSNDNYNIIDKIVDILSNILNIPLIIFKNFEDSTENSHKKQKSILNASFLSQGGTSIDILNLINEIESSCKQPLDPELINMLFDINCPISIILKYIKYNTICLEERNKQTKDLNLTEDKKALIDLEIKWKYDTKKCVDASPTLHHQIVTVGSHSHLLVNLNSENGETISTINLPDRIESQVTYSEDDDFGYIGCYDGFLYKFDPLSGIIIEKFNSHGMIKCKPLVSEEFVVFGNYGEAENVFCLLKKDFSCKWLIKLGNRGVLSSPILLEGSKIFICTLDGTCSCLDLTNGNQIWKINYTAPIFANSIYIQNINRILISEVNGKLHTISLDGKECATYQAEGNIFSSFELQILNDDIIVYFGCYDHFLYSIKIEENQINLIRKIKLQSTIYSTPKLISFNEINFIIGISSIGNINVIESETGKIINSLKLNGEIFSSPTYKDGRIYVGCRDNNLYCIEIKNCDSNLS